MPKIIIFANKLILPILKSL